jgi:hypothetical protein
MRAREEKQKQKTILKFVFREALRLVLLLCFKKKKKKKKDRLINYDSIHDIF